MLEDWENVLVPPGEDDGVVKKAQNNLKAAVSPQQTYSQPHLENVSGDIEDDDLGQFEDAIPDSHLQSTSESLYTSLEHCSPEVNSMIHEAMSTPLCAECSAQEELPPPSMSSPTTSSPTEHVGRNVQNEVLQDDYYTDTSVSLPDEVPAARVGRGFAKAFGALEEKRMAILGRRAQLQESRAGLRYQRSNLIDIDAKVIRLAGQMIDAGASGFDNQHQELLKMLRDSQDARESMQHQETEYNELENKLDREEWDLKVMESQLYQVLNSVAEADAESVIHAFSVLSEAVPPEAIFNDAASDVLTYEEVLLQRLMSRTGDAALVEEQLHDLRAERAELVEEERVLEGLGIDLSSDKQAFFSAFDQRHRELQLDLRHMYEDIVSMREDVIGHNDALYRNTQFDESEDQPIALQDDDLLKGVTQERHPLILSDDEPPMRYTDVGREVSRTTVQMPCFINAWLLEILQRSLLQVACYLNSLGELQQRLGDLALTELVLQCWTLDGTAPTTRLLTETPHIDASIQSLHSAQYTTRTIRSDPQIHVEDRLKSRLARRYHLGEHVTASMVLRAVARPFRASAHSPPKSI